MAALTVSFLRGYLEDEPTSTTVYVDGLIKALHNYPTTEIIANTFTPKMPLPSWIKDTWVGIRFARFILYPFQVPHQSSTLTHLLDHSYTHLLYSRNLKHTIVTVTDLMPIIWWKRLIPVKTIKNIPVTVLYSLHALKYSAHIITISSTTKNDLVRFLGFDPSRVSVVYLGVDDIFQPYPQEQKNELRKKLFGNERKIILITGSQFYKNHEVALKTIKYLQASGLKDIYLAKTGTPTREWLDIVKKYELENNVLNLGFIPRAQMPDLYNAVDVLMFPSMYEGFGWPPLEAMACGTPAVTSNVASLPEVMGDIDTMCDPSDALGFAKKIEMLLYNVEYCQRVVQQGMARSAQFTWEKAARETMSIYERVAK